MSNVKAEEVLRAVYAQADRPFDEELLLLVYGIQRQYQYDRDRSAAIEHIRRAVDAYIQRSDRIDGGRT